jgi:hypothetical protein
VALRIHDGTNSPGTFVSCRLNVLARRTKIFAMGASREPIFRMPTSLLSQVPRLRTTIDFGVKQASAGVAYDGNWHDAYVDRRARKSRLVTGFDMMGGPAKIEARRIHIRRPKSGEQAWGAF